MKVGIVTDELSNLPADIVEKFEINVVHGLVYIDDQKYVAGVEISSEEILQVIGKKDLKTGAPSPGEFFKIYEQLLDKYDIIFSIHCSKQTSAFIESAKIGAKRTRNPEKIKHMECGVAAIGLGLTVIGTAILSKSISDIEILEAKVSELCQKAELLGLVHSFEHLRKSGRVKLKVAGIMASLISIKPVIFMHEGKISVVEKTFSRNKSKKRFWEKFEDQFDQDFEPKLIGINHLMSKDKINEIITDIHEQYPNHEIFVSKADPMIASYTGPGLLIISFFSRYK